MLYIETHHNERGDTCAGFIDRAVQWFATHNVTVQRVMTDNASNYRRSRLIQQALTNVEIRHPLTRPYRPPANGKAERLNQTLINEWAYNQLQSTGEALASTGVGCDSIEPTYGEFRPGDIRHKLADISQAQEDLGYPPPVNLAEGFNAAVRD